MANKEEHGEEGECLNNGTVNASTSPPPDNNNNIDDDAAMKCEIRASKGECTSNQDYMFKHCPFDCMDHPDLGVYGYIPDVDDDCKDNDDNAMILSRQKGKGGEFDKLASIMGIDVDVLEKAFINKTIKVGGQSIQSPLPPQQAEEGCNAYAKDLYSKIFDYLVATINSATSASDVHKKKDDKVKKDDKDKDGSTAAKNPENSSKDEQSKTSEEKSRSTNNSGRAHQRPSKFEQLKSISTPPTDWHIYQFLMVERPLT